jgi:hypothetical protein
VSFEISGLWNINRLPIDFKVIFLSENYLISIIHCCKALTLNDLNTVESIMNMKDIHNIFLIYLKQPKSLVQRHHKTDRKQIYTAKIFVFER